MSFDYQPLPSVDLFPSDWDTHTIPDYHSVVSIQICELYNDGFFNLAREDWDFGPKYSAEQHAQLCKKITEHYWYREIALTPPAVWKREFLRKMTEIMPKYMKWYELVNSEDMHLGHTYDIVTGSYTKQDLGSGSNSTNRTVNETVDNDEYYKSRNIFSDFPQTSLTGNNQDYASTGNDIEYEQITDRDRDETESVTGSNTSRLDGSKNYSENRVHIADPFEFVEDILKFDNVDASIINEIEPLFSCLFTVNINGF